MRPDFIKRISRELVEKYGHLFKKDFEHNKRVLARIAKIQSKRMRNWIAGYITTYLDVLETRAEMEKRKRIPY